LLVLVAMTAPTLTNPAHAATTITVRGYWFHIDRDRQTELPARAMLTELCDDIDDNYCYGPFSKVGANGSFDITTDQYPRGNVRVMLWAMAEYSRNANIHVGSDAGPLTC
jgi:hypothetical protein